MAIKVLRKKSTIPTITNRIDARMVRYAYGGQDGVVKSYGNECALEGNSASRQITIKDGIFVLQGWEIQVEAPGYVFTFPTTSAKTYYTLYLELTLANEKAEIKQFNSLSTYPDITPGDDLTRNNNGTARMKIGTFIFDGSSISSLAKTATTIEYEKTKVQKLETEIQTTYNKIPRYELIWEGSKSSVGSGEFLSPLKNGDLVKIEIAASSGDENLRDMQIVFARVQDSAATGKYHKTFVPDWSHFNVFRIDTYEITVTRTNINIISKYKTFNLSTMTPDRNGTGLISIKKIYRINYLLKE